MALERLKRLANNIINLDLDRIVNIILSDRDVQDFIINLNTEGQLFKGIDSLGVSLDSIGGDYAASTKARKGRKGQPTDRVTLKDSGDFYKTFDIDVFAKGFTIEADTIKSGQDLEGRWGDKLVGLTKENKILLVQKLKRLISNAILRKIRS